MKVFIVWSGDLSKEVALLLHKYLRAMVQSLSVFMSKHDIESGANWVVDLRRELDERSFGLLCLTTDNLNAHWVLYEAGALAKHTDGKACGVLLAGLRATDIKGPLSHFQHRLFEKEEMWQLLRDLNAKVEKPLESEELRASFEKWWPELEAAYHEAQKVSPSQAAVRRNTEDLLEEALTRIRVIERAVSTQALRAIEPPLSFEELWQLLTPAEREIMFKLLPYERATLNGHELDELVLH